MAFKNVSVTEAPELLKKPGTKYLDVRTPAEFKAGHAPGAINVPVMLSGPGGMAPNPDFMKEVQAAIPEKDTPLVVGCKSGARSQKAAGMLETQAYVDLTNLVGGFDAWQSQGLPVE